MEDNPTFRIKGLIELTVDGTGDESPEGDGGIERYEFDLSFPLGEGPSSNDLFGMLAMNGVEPIIIPRQEGKDFSDYQMDEAR